MSETFLERAFARSLIGVTALAAGVLTLAPAVSAAEKYDVRPDISDVALHPGDSVTAKLLARVEGLTDVDIAVKVSVDLSAFGGKLSLKGDGCTASGAVYTCAATVNPKDPTDDYPGHLVSRVTFTAAADLVPVTRTLTWKLTSDKSDAAQTSQTVKVFDEGTLLGDGDRSVNARPGDRLSLPFAMRNSGGTDVRTPAVEFTLPITFDPSAWPSNCWRQQEEQRFHIRWRVICAFDTTAKAGTAYRLANPLDISIAPDTPTRGPFASPRIEYKWGADPGHGDGWTKGDGPALTLAAGGTAPTSPKPDGVVTVHLTGTDNIDLALTATPIKGKVGDKVKVTFTVTNVGRTAVIAHEQRAPLIGVGYGVPAGLKADRPENGMLGKGLRWAEGTVYHLRAGQSTTITVEFTIEKIVRGASAEAAIYARDGESDDITLHEDDVNANHHVTLKPDIAGAGNGPLAKTGFSAPVIAGVAGFLVVTGGAAVLLGRRRTRKSE